MLLTLAFAISCIYDTPRRLLCRHSTPRSDSADGKRPLVGKCTLERRWDGRPQRRKRTARVGSQVEAVEMLPGDVEAKYDSSIYDEYISGSQSGVYSFSTQLTLLISRFCTSHCGEAIVPSASRDFARIDFISELVIASDCWSVSPCSSACNSFSILSAAASTSCADTSPKLETSASAKPGSTYSCIWAFMPRPPTAFFARYCSQRSTVSRLAS